MSSSCPFSMFGAQVQTQKCSNVIRFLQLSGGDGARELRATTGTGRQTAPLRPCSTGWVWVGAIHHGDVGGGDWG